jgi:hypothetical protein
MSLSERNELIRLLANDSMFSDLSDKRRNRIDKKLKKIKNFILDDEEDAIVENVAYCTHIDLPQWVIAVPVDDQDDDVISGAALTTFNSVAQLATFCFEDLQTNESTCPICINNFTNKSIVRQLPCRHIFCDECILKWFDHSNQCPKCRGNI